MIFITGDCHFDFRRFNTKNFPEQKEMTRDDYIMVCGDFRLIWKDKETNQEKYWIKWFENKPFTLLFIDGNHENFKSLYNYPIKDFCGGKVHEIRPNILHLMRGEVFNLEDKKFFIFGGAQSHDISDGILDPIKDRKLINRWLNDPYQSKLFRINEVTWWKEELPSQEEMENGLKNLEKNNNEVDFIISHCGPQNIVSVMSQGIYKPDILTTYLSNISEDVKFTKWYFGHYHQDKQIMGKFNVLYENIVRIV